MKKLLKFMGLLLVAGALFMGCQQNVDIDTDEITLSEGDWSMNQNSSFTFTDEDGYKASISAGFTALITVEGDAFTFKSVTRESVFSVTCPSEAEANYLKAAWDLGKETGETVSQNGKTVTSKTSNKLTDAELKEDFGGKYSAKNVEKGFDGAKLKTNKKKTEYKLSYKDTRTYNGQSYDADVVITFKKK